MEIKRFGEKAEDFIFTPIEDDARINILHGAVRSQKTWAMIPKLLYLNQQGPEGLGVITGVSKNTVYDNVLRDLIAIVGDRFIKYNRQSGDLLIYDKPWKVIGARDEGSEKYIRGLTVAKAYMDEMVLCPESFFKQLLNRMSVPNARLYATTNPSGPFHWLYKDFIINEEMIKRGDIKSIHFTLEDNTSLSEEYKAFIKKAYGTGAFYHRFVLGEWVVAEGAIYKDCFGPENVFDDAEVEKRNLLGRYAERYVGIDYGTINPFAAVDILDDGDTLWVLRELYYYAIDTGIQKTDKELADLLVDWISPDAQLVIDPSAASFKIELINRGIIPFGLIDKINANNDVANGIRRLSTMMSLRKLMVHNSCQRLLEEIGAYSWDDKARMRGEEQPLKANDHLCDALRYAVLTKVSDWRVQT